MLVFEFGYDYVMEKNIRATIQLFYDKDSSEVFENAEEAMKDCVTYLLKYHGKN